MSSCSCRNRSSSSSTLCSLAAAEVVVQVRSLGANPEAGRADLEFFSKGQVVLGLCDPLGNPQISSFWAPDLCINDDSVKCDVGNRIFLHQCQGNASAAQSSLQVGDKYQGEYDTLLFIAVLLLAGCSQVQLTALPTYRKLT